MISLVLLTIFIWVFFMVQHKKPQYCILIIKPVCERILNYDLDSINNFKIDTIYFIENNIQLNKNLLIEKIEVQKINEIEKEGIVIPISETNYNSLIAVFDAMIQCDLDVALLDNNNLNDYPHLYLNRL